MITGVDQNSLFEAAMNILLRGGWVLAPIFLLGWFGWFLMLERYGYYFMLRGKSVSGISMRWRKTCAITAGRGLSPCVTRWRLRATAYP